MVLIALVQFHEISAPSPDSHYQVPVKFRMHFRIKKLIPVKGVQLQLMASHLHIGTYQHRQFFHGLVIAEDAFVKLYGKRSSIDGIFKVRLRE